MSYDNGVSFSKTKDHYHSTKCKTCIHCQLCAEFPRPWENKIDEPVNYCQEYAPQCVGCAYWDEWKTIEPEEHGSMEYKESKNMASFNPNDPSIRAIRQRMVPGDKVRDLPQYPADDIKKGQKYAIALPRWISGNSDQQMYDIAIAIKDMKGEGGVVFRPHVMMGDSTQSVKGPLSEIHAQLAVKKIHEQMDKELSNITASCVARTRPIKSESRLLTDWQTEILEIMEANGVPEENIGKVLDLI